MTLAMLYAEEVGLDVPFEAHDLPVTRRRDRGRCDALLTARVRLAVTRCEC